MPRLQYLNGGNHIAMPLLGAPGNRKKTREFTNCIKIYINISILFGKLLTY
jgi:hypothetical protein